MTNCPMELEEYADIEIHNLYRDRMAQGYAHEDVMRSIHKRGRDNARTPMQWTAGKNAGFTSGKPWLKVNDNCAEINAEAALADSDSVYYYYQKLIALRKELEVFRSGRFELVDADNEKVFAYTRDTEDEHLLVICNFTGEEVPLVIPERFHGAKCLISNYDDETAVLRPYEAGMLYY